VLIVFFIGPITVVGHEGSPARQPRGLPI